MPSSNIIDRRFAGDGDAPLTPLALSMGDPSGVGPEIVAKAWTARARHNLPPFFVVGQAAALRAVWDGPIAPIADPTDAARRFAEALPLFEIAGECPPPGIPDSRGAAAAFEALEVATGLVRAGSASALVTGPVSKACLYDVGFSYPGQTEFVAERCGIARENAVMMLAGPSLRVVPITTHLSLADAVRRLDTALIRDVACIVAKGLKRNFGIPSPRLVLAGLNPHAGEAGAMGREEMDVMAPAVASLRALGIEITGPLPADTLFHEDARARYDAALCGYHDQALIPVKTLHFHDAVNITLGLPIVRTSPDHGTAFDIAGRGIARADSMIAAIRMAAEAVVHRRAAATARDEETGGGRRVAARSTDLGAFPCRF